MRYPWLAAIAAAALALGVAACGSSSDDSSSSGSSSSGGSLSGAGATFPAPFYSELASQIKDKDGLTVNYNGVGSGAGVAQFTQKTVDFGASDPPLKDDELAAAKTAGGTDVVQVPTVLGAITVSYNVSGVEKGLKLDGATIADIFSGKITKWNDAAIAGLNSGRRPAGHGHHDLPPLGLVGHDEELHDVPRDLRLDVGEDDRRRQDGQVARRHRRQGQRRRRGLRQAERRRQSDTSRRRTRCRTTSTPQP